MQVAAEGWLGSNFAKEGFLRPAVAVRGPKTRFEHRQYAIG
jgi:hypothetical protein